MKKYNRNFLFRTITLYFLLIYSFSWLISCTYNTYSHLPEYQFKSINKNPDYADLNYWAAHPWKKNISDSVPKPLRSNFLQDSSVDVFFIHPTTLTAMSDLRWNADIDDAKLNAKTDYSTILYQASVFNGSCRVFAPRYRQAHIKSFYVVDSISDKYFEIAYQDIKTAFVYYLNHYNNGRPIIIASHSQGTKHAARLLKEFFENKPLQKQLVCAYIIGMPIPENYFSDLNPCHDSLSSGCFVGWRTFKDGYIEPKFVAKETYKSIVINPLNWTSDSDFVSSKYNLGGVLLNFNKIIPHAVNAKIHQNVLWTSRPNVFFKFLVFKRNYHVGDINLFYMNIRENVAARILAYKKLNSP